MRYHLDTSFLVDWQRREDRVRALVEDILAGEHEVSVDPIVHTEFFAAKVFERRIEFVFNNILALGRWIPLTAETCTTASRWLAPMDKAQRRAHFADALIAAVAGVEGATLLTHDGIMASLFPISVQVY